MYERYWQLSRNPFADDADPEFFFAGRSHQAALLKLRYLVENRKPAALLTGVGGSGKSYLLNILSQQLDESGTLVRLAFPQFSPGELLAYLAVKLGADEAVIHSTASRDVTLRHIESRLQHYTRSGRYVVIAVDEAQFIEDRHVWQALQLLFNLRQSGRSEFSLVLAGQPELIGQLARLSQFEDRLAFKCLLQPLSQPEVAAYVKHRLGAAGATESLFDQTAIQALFELSGGLPRRINRLCDLALLVGYAESLPTLSAAQIEAVNEELTTTAAAA